MPSYKTILVAIKDLDARTMPVVRKAAQLAKSQGATLELFHALSDTILVDALEAKRISLKDFEAERLAATQKRLETLAKRIRKHDIEVTCAAEWDYPPAEAIVRRAMRIKADLIVAERHATRHVAGWMLAYTDWELLRHAPCAVLLVKVAKPYHRPVILTAIDPFHAHEKPARLDVALLAASAWHSGTGVTAPLPPNQDTRLSTTSWPIALRVCTEAGRWPRPAQFELLLSVAATLAEDFYRRGRLESFALGAGPAFAVRRLSDLERALDCLALAEPGEAFLRRHNFGLLFRDG